MKNFKIAKVLFWIYTVYMTLAKEVSMINLDMFGNEIME